MGRVLLVDDDPGVLAAYAGLLRTAGHLVRTASSGKEALDQIRERSFDVVVSDIAMPEMTGLDFLKAVRGLDLEVPVVLMTAGPAVETAVQAVEFGAFRYLVKPIDRRVLMETLERAITLHELARVKRQALELAGLGPPAPGDRAALETRFEQAMAGLWIAFQPIVSWGRREVFGYEALARTEEPSLARPLDFVQAAERLGRLRDLGRAVRARVAAEIARAPHDALIFINLHPRDLEDEELVSRSAPLAAAASRVVLEITERASLDDLEDVPGRARAARKLGYRLAVDDLGAGHAGLASFNLLEPEIVKLDMTLVRGVDAEVRKQAVVRSMATLCGELGAQVVTEGVETASERDTLASLGCDLLQGYLFARPARGYPGVTF